MKEHLTERESLAMLKALAEEIRSDNKWTGLERVRIIQVKEIIARQWREASKSAEESVEKAESELDSLTKSKAPSNEIHSAQLKLATCKGAMRGMLQTFATIGMIIESGAIQDSEATVTATISEELARKMKKHFDEADRLMEREIGKQRAAHNGN